MLKHRAIRLVAIVAAGLVATCAAQNAPSQWTQTITSKVIPSHRAEFEGYLKQIMEGYRKAGVPWFVTLNNVAGDYDEYSTIIPIKFADIGTNSLQKALGEENYANVVAGIRRTYTSQTRLYSLEMPDQSFHKSGVPYGEYWIETRVLTSNGKIQDYLTWFQNEMKPAIQKGSAAHLMASRPIFGTASGEFRYTRMLSSLAELDKGPYLTQAIGADAARALNAKSVPLVRSTSMRIMRVNSKLTFSPPPPSK